MLSDLIISLRNIESDLEVLPQFHAPGHVGFIDDVHHGINFSSLQPFDFACRSIFRIRIYHLNWRILELLAGVDDIQREEHSPV